MIAPNPVIFCYNTNGKLSSRKKQMIKATKITHVHFLGIGGSGASAVASLAKAFGYRISGCDKDPYNEYTKPLSSRILSKGHSPAHLKGVDLLVLTPAILYADPQNLEITTAKEKQIPTITWQEFMGKYLHKDKYIIAVCGTHGKSTTTAMIGLITESGELDPTVDLGTIVPKWGANFRVGGSQYFISEADEFNDNFLHIHPHVTVVTTIEPEHLDYFKNFTEVKNSFRKFLSSTKDLIVANLKDRGVQQVLKIGKYPKIVDYSQKLIDFPLKIPGDYNILNASAAYQVGLNLGIDPKIIRKALMNYTSIGRRFEYIGTIKGASLYSDYGHHPTEIQVTIKAAREKFPDKKIIVMFQPHLFSRTKLLFKKFVRVFRNLPADQTIITDIYSAREKDTGIVNSNQLVASINKADTHYIPDFEGAKDYLDKKLGKDTVVFFVGAGSIDQMAREFVKDYE